MLTKELKDLQNKYTKPDSDLATSNNINYNQLIKVGRSCWAKEQYSRRECLEISGIRDSISQMICKIKFATFSVNAMFILTIPT